MGYVCVGPRELMKIARSEPDPDVKRLKSKLAMEKLKLPPKIAKTPEQLEEIAQDKQQDFNSLPISEAVEMIDTGLHTGPYVCENTIDNLSVVVKAIEGRLNVVYVINKEGKIQIF
jgi:hypothetical protein